jgi:hypothetical protein
MGSIIGCLLGGILWMWPQIAHAQITYIPLLPGEEATLCRFGVNGALHDYPVSDLRIGWYVDYQATRITNDPQGISYYPMIRLEQLPGGNFDYSIFINRLETSDSQLQAVIDAHPGAYWFIGNEPDRRQFQDDLEPFVYAKAYHYLYHRIKGADPTAKIVAGTIVQPTPLRLLYLDQIVQSYFDQFKVRMPVDVWSFHNFVLNEASCAYYAQFIPGPDLLNVCWGADIPPGITAVDGQRIDVQSNADIDIFKAQVVAFRKWMAKWGYRDTPAFLSEFGVLMPAGLFNPDFDVVRVNTFMNQAFDFLMNERDLTLGDPGDDYRLVQRFSWYSIEDSIDHNGQLFDRNNPNRARSRTPFGDNFAAYTARVDINTDFKALAVGPIDPPPLTSGGATTVTLEAVIANSGNGRNHAPAQVTFYNGDPRAGGVQIGASQEIQISGCGERATVRMAWGGVAPGDYTVFAQVTNFGDERTVDNNVVSGSVRFAEEQLFLPGLSSALTPR